MAVWCEALRTALSVGSCLLALVASQGGALDKLTVVSTRFKSRTDWAAFTVMLYLMGFVTSQRFTRHFVTIARLADGATLAIWDDKFPGVIKTHSTTQAVGIAAV